MNNNSTELDISLSRRTILKTGLASAALLLVQGCSVFGSSDELDEAFAQLGSKLLDLEKNTDQESRLIRISFTIRPVAAPVFSAQSIRRDGVHSRCSRCERGICSGSVENWPGPLSRRCDAIRFPRNTTSTILAVTRASTFLCMSW